MSGADASSQAAFADWARASTRRYIAPPLIVSAAAAAAVVATVPDLTVRLEGRTGAELLPVFERFLGDGFCRTIAALFFAAAIYGGLQLVGAAVDRRRLKLLSHDRAGPSWIALLTGRPFRPVPRTEWTGAVSGDPREAADRFASQRQRYVDLGQLPLRFAVWALPLLGFIGTVVGVARSIGGLEAVISATPGGDSSDGLLMVLGGLRFAFDTTLLGLASVIPVMVLQMILGGRESSVTEESGRRVLALLAKPPLSSVNKD